MTSFLWIACLQEVAPISLTSHVPRSHWLSMFWYLRSCNWWTQATAKGHKLKHQQRLGPLGYSSTLLQLIIWAVWLNSCLVSRTSKFLKGQIPANLSSPNWFVCFGLPTFIFVAPRSTLNSGTIPGFERKCYHPFSIAFVFRQLTVSDTFSVTAWLHQAQLQFGRSFGHAGMGERRGHESPWSRWIVTYYPSHYGGFSPFTARFTRTISCVDCQSEQKLLLGM